jgi:hypothetical protein
LDRVGTPGFGQPHRSGHGGDHPARIFHRRQVGEPDAIGELVDEAGSRLYRQTCLAGSSGTDDRHQPGAPDQLVELGELLMATDEAGHLCREVVPAMVHGPQGREVRRELGVRDLPDPERTFHVAEPVFAEVGDSGPLGYPGAEQFARHA